LPKLAPSAKFILWRYCISLANPNVLALEILSINPLGSKFKEFEMLFYQITGMGLKFYFKNRKY